MSVSGLSDRHVMRARRIVQDAALLGLHHAPMIHYTQGPKRWNGINNRRRSATGHFPHFADCSSYVTWCLWNALALEFHRPDTVNGAGWRAGFTGTLLDHGQPVRHLENVRRGDLVLYGTPGTTGRHVTIVVRRVHRPGEVPLVVSHGSEGGPFLLPYNYRLDVIGFRRYI